MLQYNLELGTFIFNELLTQKSWSFDFEVLKFQI
jgi:hypothetical protein